jgi:hypothetical protein
VVFRIPGHPAFGQIPSGELVRFDHEDAFRPSMLQSVGGGPVADGGWVVFRKHRLFLSEGKDGTRLVHPFGPPPVERHLSTTGILPSLLEEGPSIAVFGPAGAGKSLLAALAARQQASGGWRVLYVSGIPTHDLADGAYLLHEVVKPGQSLERARDALERWRPDQVILDLPPVDDLPGLVRAARLSGSRIMVTARTADETGAREFLRLAAGSPAGWQLVSPWPVAEGPKLDLSHAAA